MTSADFETIKAAFIASVIEVVACLDTPAGYGWSKINEYQDPNWENINEVVSTVWAAINEAQTPNWESVASATSTEWSIIDEGQTPNWTPINSDQ